MSASLSVDCGSATTIGALGLSGGLTVPVHIDGRSYLPSLVAVGSDGVLYTGSHAARMAADQPETVIAAPIVALPGPPITIAGRLIDPIDAVSALLVRMFHEATALVGQTPTRVLLAAPAGWGPRRRGLLRTAAERAGLPDPQVVSAPAAAASYIAHVSPTALPVEATAAICDVGASGVTAAVLLRTGATEWETLSTIVRRTSVTATSTAAGRSSNAPGTTVAASAPGAMDILVAGSPCIPDHPHTGAAAASNAGTLPALAAAVVAEAVEAADIEDGGLTTVAVIGGNAGTPGLVETLQQTSGAPAYLVPRPTEAVTLGALRAAHAEHRSGWARAGRGNDALWPLPILLAAALGSLTIWVLNLVFTFIDYNYGLDQVMYVGLDKGSYGVACILAVIAALAAVRSFILLEIERHQTNPRFHPRPVRILVGAGGVLLIVAAIYGLISGVYFGVPSGPYVWLAIEAEMPVLVIGGWIAVTLPRLAYLGAPALDPLRHPVTGIALAVAGEATLLVANGSSLDIPVQLGGALMGAACAWTVTRTRIPRILAVTALVIVGAVACGFHNRQLLGYGYIACECAWMIRAAWELTATAFPQWRHPAAVAHRDLPPSP